MLIVSRDILRDLASSQLQEADGKPYSHMDFYKDFCVEHKKLLDSLASDPKKLFKAYDALRTGWLAQHRAHIKYVGQGSSRICFALSGGKCLKIAFNEKGRLQNLSEAKISEKLPKLSCFTKLYAIDKSTNGASILTECVAPAKPEDFIELLGESYFAVSNVLIEAVKREDWDLKQKMSELAGKEDKISKWMLDFCRKMRYEKSARMSVFRDLLAFWKKSGAHASSPEELRNFRNWGIGIRAGQEVLLILDFGLSAEVLKLYH